MRRLAGKLRVSVEQLETGEPTAVEQGVANAGLEYGSLTAKELRAIQAAADEGARNGTREAALKVLERRRKQGIAKLEKRLNELGG